MVVMTERFHVVDIVAPHPSIALMGHIVGVWVAVKSSLEMERLSANYTLAPIPQEAGQT
jgi:hypothetical protein